MNLKYLLVQMNVNFNGTVKNPTHHVGISCKSKAIVDTTIISAAERQTLLLIK